VRIHYRHCRVFTGAELRDVERVPDEWRGMFCATSLACLTTEFVRGCGNGSLMFGTASVLLRSAL